MDWIDKLSPSQIAKVSLLISITSLVLSGLSLYINHRLSRHRSVADRRPKAAKEIRDAIGNLTEEIQEPDVSCAKILEEKWPSLERQLRDFSLSLSFWRRRSFHKAIKEFVSYAGNNYIDPRLSFIQYGYKGQSIDERKKGLNLAVRRLQKIADHAKYV
jgi:hypothetical protein